ncbi:MAG: ribosome biogenesis GTP-binding protein YihA/YsxC [Betaproteobacteria bacterium]
MTTKRAIVTDSSRPAKAGTALDDSGPHPLRGAEFVIGAAAPAQLPVEGAPEIAFAGRSNAGKSSAINALALRTRLAFASRTPGRTQQINLFLLRSGALIADLPGYGYAAVAKSIKRVWQDFLWHYTTTRSTLIALVLVVDSRHALKEADLEILRGFVPSGRPVLILATKADKLTTTEQRKALREIEAQLKAEFPTVAGNVKVQLFSASTRQGVPEAEVTIAQWLPDAPLA